MSRNVVKQESRGGWLRRLGIYFLPFLFTISGAFVLIWSISTGVTSLRSEHWPTVSGTVISSAIRTDRVRGGFVYKPLVTYQYEVGGHPFEGHAITVSDGADTEQMAKIIIAAFPFGRSVVVYVDPHDPSHGILQPGINSSVVLSAILAIVAILLGTLVIPWVIRHKRGRQLTI